MKVEIQLVFAETRVDIIEEYPSLDEARYVWLEGPMACDCCRVDYLRESGLVGNDHSQPCNAPGEHAIHLLSLKPFVIH